MKNMVGIGIGIDCGSNDALHVKNEIVLHDRSESESERYLTST